MQQQNPAQELPAWHFKPHPGANLRGDFAESHAEPEIHHEMLVGIVSNSRLDSTQLNRWITPWKPFHDALSIYELGAWGLFLKKCRQVQRASRQLVIKASVLWPLSTWGLSGHSRLGTT